ncbi:YibE/F family protein [Candidatus Woesebacteria bacterium]|nr:YibE/F family protein [Candidatus Woesebacteria bacterium]
MKKFIFIIITIFTILVASYQKVSAQVKDPQDTPFEETLEGEVVEILEEKEINDYGSLRIYQKLRIEITKGSLEGKDINVENGKYPTANLVEYKIGDRLVIYRSKDIQGNDMFLISDYVRRDALFILFLIFALLVIFVDKAWGLTSILGMGFSFLITFKFILPQIIRGSDPVLTAIIGSIFIILVTFYLSHGFNKKTHIAIAGTFISLIITGVTASVFVNYSKLTGFASEEAGFLNFERQGSINMKGLLLAGIIIGTLGVLDDVTVSQSAIVYQLRSVNRRLRLKQLYKKAMNVGHDHVSSMVNTLVLVYTGAAMPLLLLFVNNPRPISEVINYEIIADEIVRTLVGSIGLVLAVPITTFLAAFIITRK